MYCTLDKIDSVARDNDVVVLAVQTDHRTAQEIDAEEPLSTLFALAKVLGAARLVAPTGKVVYACAELPPAAFQQVLAAAGAELHVGEYPNPIAVAAEGPPVVELVARAMRRLAARHPGPRDLPNLFALEERLVAELAALREDFDEPGVIAPQYFGAVLTLSAVAGEVFAAHRTGAMWMASPRRLAHEVLPFLFVHDDPRDTTKSVVSFLVDKAMSALAAEPEESVTTMVARALGAPPPPVLSPPKPKRRGLWGKLFG